MDTAKKVQISLILLVVLLSSGTLGYSQIEGWTLFESLYMTVITLATVGYSEVHRLSHTGQVFTIILIIFGVGTIAYSIGSALQLMVEGQLLQILGRKHLLKRIQSLQNHHIICGYGRIGRQISREFAARPLSFILVDKSLIDAEIRKTFGLIIVGIIKAGVTTMTFNPAGDMVVRGGDTLISLGPHPQVQQFARIAAQGR